MERHGTTQVCFQIDIQISSLIDKKALLTKLVRHLVKTFENLNQQKKQF